MNRTIPTLPASGESQTRTAPPSRRAHYFFVGMAGLFLLVAAAGFGPNYQAIINGASKPHWLVHVHGALMSGWLLVFLAQTILAARGHFKYHFQLGLSSVALGVLVWFTMGAVAVHMIVANHPPEGHFLFDLITMVLNGMVTFGLFFTWGLLVRKKDPTAHKRLLLLATQVTLQAAIDRIHWLPMFGIGYPYIYFMYMDALLLPLIVYDLVVLRRIHRITLFGSACIIAAQLSVWALWASPAWHKFWYDLTVPYTEKIVEITLSEAPTEPLLGQYGWEKWNLSVTREGGRLFVQFTGQDRQELGAISETVFFPRTDIGTYTFVKDARGTVAKVVAHAGSQTQELPRMNQP